MEYERGNARLRLHHHSLGQPDPDSIRREEFEEGLLPVEVRAGGVTKAVALAPIVRAEKLPGLESVRICEAPRLLKNSFILFLL